MEVSNNNNSELTRKANISTNNGHDFPMVIIDNKAVTNGLHTNNGCNTAGSQSPNDDYDPHLFRDTSDGTTNFQTLVHLIKGSIGTGILLMPKAFSSVGIVTGFCLTFLTGFLCTYCFHILVKCQYKLCKRQKIPMITYSDTIKLAMKSGPVFLRYYSDLFGHLINGFILVYQMGICCVYIVFIAESVRVVYPINNYLCMIIVTIILIPIMFIRNLKKLAPLSTLANCFLLSSFSIIFYYVFSGPLPAVGTLKKVGPVSAVPLFFGTTLFAIEAIGVFLSVEGEMRNPKDFSKILNFGLSWVTVLYAFMGFVGYWRYGEQIADTISNNLNSDDLLAQVTKIAIAIAILFSYPLQCYVSVEIIWETWLKKRFASKQNTLFYENVLRASIVIITFIFAALVPLLDLITSLFGALCLSVLGISFPALIELCTRWPNNFGAFKWIFVKDLVLIVIGLFAMITGTSKCIEDIIKNLQQGSS